jgi:hypothetical protein
VLKSTKNVASITVFVILFMTTPFINDSMIKYFEENRFVHSSMNILSTSNAFDDPCNLSVQLNILYFGSKVIMMRPLYELIILVLQALAPKFAPQNVNR